MWHYLSSWSCPDCSAPSILSSWRPHGQRSWFLSSPFLLFAWDSLTGIWSPILFSPARGWINSLLANQRWQKNIFTQISQQCEHPGTATRSLGTAVSIWIRSAQNQAPTFWYFSCLRSGLWGRPTGCLFFPLSLCIFMYKHTCWLLVFCLYFETGISLASKLPIRPSYLASKL